MDRVDILIAGGGLAGLGAAARLSADGLGVTLVDPAPADAGGSADLRTTAFLHEGIATLEAAGVWTALAEKGAALRVMRIVEGPEDMADFREEETPAQRFGVNIANRDIHVALLEALEARDNVTLLRGHRVTGLSTTDSHAAVVLDDGRELTADLVIAADGRDSTLRQLAGIGYRRWEYGQSALVFNVSHALPHQNISTEIHAHGGPLTFVPMPDTGDDPCSAVVWMRPHDRARQLADLCDAGLLAELQAESLGLLGAFHSPGPRALWPIIGQLAHRLNAPRLALIAEAAHVIPPIGAQGLNMSLDDIETLARLIDKARQRGRDIGGASLLNGYNRRHWPITALRVGGVDAMNRLAAMENTPAVQLRKLGLNALNRLPPLRKLAIHAGLNSRIFR